MRSFPANFHIFRSNLISPLLSFFDDFIIHLAFKQKHVGAQLTPPLLSPTSWERVPQLFSNLLFLFHSSAPAFGHFLPSSFLPSCVKPHITILSYNNPGWAGPLLLQGLGFLPFHCSTIFKYHCHLHSSRWLILETEFSKKKERWEMRGHIPFL